MSLSSTVAMPLLTILMPADLPANRQAVEIAVHAAFYETHSTTFLSTQR
jgi:hypothetical protein